MHDDEVSELKDTISALKLEVQRLRDEMQKLMVVGVCQTSENGAMQNKSYAAATRADGGMR